MPYKEKLQNLSKNPRDKIKYKVTNNSEYNKALKKRGKLSLYFPEGDLKSQFINEESYKKGISGREDYYSKSYIMLIYTFYRLLKFPMRQITGYVEDLWQGKNLDIKVPSFGHLSDLFASLELEVKHYCHKLVNKLEEGEDVSLILDSTGMSFDKASGWYEEKYNKACKKRPWRKLHISINDSMEMFVSELTDNQTSDIRVMKTLITPKNINVDKVIADGGYYSIDGVESLINNGIMPVIPPPSHATVQNKENSTWHDKIAEYIKDKGTVYAFHQKYGYSIRSKVEAQFSRIKRCIGSSLMTEKLESQKRESIIIANIINLWNSFGMPNSVKNA
jgi:hypothetical protein